MRLWSQRAGMTAGRKQELATERKYCVAHAARRHGHAYRHSHDQLLHLLGDRLVAHTPMPDVFSRAMGNYAYLLRDPDENALKEAISMVHEGG